MSMSNIEYSVLKKKSGLHNWGFLSDEEFDPEEFVESDVLDYPALRQNAHGDYYTLQDEEWL